MPTESPSRTRKSVPMGADGPRTATDRDDGRARVELIPGLMGADWPANGAPLVRWALARYTRATPRRQPTITGYRPGFGSLVVGRKDVRRMANRLCHR